MKIGDTIICIDNTSDIGRYHLTIGKRYKILDIEIGKRGLKYRVCNDVNYKCFHEASLFKDLQRKEKLEKINSISRL